VSDAHTAVNAGADALGFVFYDKSPRCVSVTQAAEMIRTLPPFVAAVGLFVNAAQADIDQAVAYCGLDVVQLHGDESPEFCRRQSKPVIKEVAIESNDDFLRVQSYDCTVLLDARAPEGVYGGVGRCFDWSGLSALKVAQPLILAGGLTPDNLNQALRLRDWYGVDVSSGVEKAKGIKDDEKVRDFCRQVHQFNGRVW